MTLSHQIKVHGSNMHYLEAGNGDPMLFLHGMPTSSYVWRNIIPQLSDVAHCIAPDLIGMGKSDKPDIEYRIFDHIRYIDGFIEQLNLDKITLVLHGWGSLIGFDYARRHPDKIKALAFFESHIRPATSPEMLSLPVQQFLAAFQDQKAAEKAVIEQNYMVKKLLPKCILRNLEPEEMAVYLAPFPTPESRRPLWQYVKDLPKGDGRGGGISATIFTVVTKKPDSKIDDVCYSWIYYYGRYCAMGKKSF